MDQSNLHDSIGILTYAKFGKIADKLEQSASDHNRTYSVLVALKKGKLALDDVTIIDGGWEIEITK